MKTIMKNIPVLLLALFEILVGILLFRDPEGFTAAALLIFGILLALIGAYYLLRASTARKGGQNDIGATVLGVLALLVGLFCIFGRKLIIGLFPVLAVLYGVLLILSGLYKFYSWLECRRAGLRVSPLLLISCLAALICGVVIALNPFTAVLTLWRFAAIALIVEAALDILSVLLEGAVKA